MSKEDLWLDDLLCGEKLSGTEKLWRGIYNICDEFHLLIRLLKYPLTSNRPEYSIVIYKQDKLGKWGKELYKDTGMELEPILKKLKKWLVEYKDKHKEYNLTKPGGGVMI